MARTIPAAFLTGLSSGYRLFHLVKIEGAASTLYWTTAGTNLAGSTLVLTATAGSASLTYDSSMIAFKQMGPGGQEEMVDGIGAMEASVDISGGGAVASVSDVDIEILNQARYDETIISAANHLENRPITIYLGFIPSGTTPTVVIADDMIARWTGVVDDVFDLDYSRLFLRCVDGSFLRDKQVPLTEIDKETYPNAPADNIGRAIPLVWGDFSPSDVESQRKIMTFCDAIPMIKSDDVGQTFILSAHALHTYTDAWIHSDSGRVFGVLDNNADASGPPHTVQFSGLISAIFYQQPKNAQTRNGVPTTVPGNEETVDEDLATYATIEEGGTTNKLVAYTPNKISEHTETATSVFVSFGTISVGANTVTVYSGDPTVSASNLGTAVDADSDTDMEFPNADYLTANYSGVVPVSIFVDTSGTARVKNVYLEVTMGVATLRGRGFRTLRNRG